MFSSGIPKWPCVPGVICWQARIQDFLGGVKTFTSTPPPPPPRTLSAWRHPPSEKLKNTPMHSCTYSQAPPPWTLPMWRNPHILKKFVEKKKIGAPPPGSAPGWLVSCTPSLIQSSDLASVVHGSHGGHGPCWPVAALAYSRYQVMSAPSHVGPSATPPVMPAHSSSLCC